MTLKVISVLFFCVGVCVTLAANETAVPSNNTAVGDTAPSSNNTAVDNTAPSSNNTAVDNTAPSSNNTAVNNTDTSSNDVATNNTSTLSNNTVVENTNQTSGNNTITTPSDKSAGPVQYIISHEDKPCILANFTTTIRISYLAEGEFNQSVAKTKTVSIGDDVDMLGSQCPQNNGGVAKLSLRWGEGTFKLVLNFKIEDRSDTNDSLEIWSLNEVLFTYDRGDKAVFPDAVVPEEMTASKDNLTLFQATVGESYGCATGDDINVGEIEKGAAITLKDIRLQPFGVEGKEFSKATVCEADKILEKMKSENWMVPVVVAGCLAFIIIVVITVYVITRNSKKAGYRNMD